MKCQVGGFCHRSIITYKEVVSPPICLILKKLTFPAAINETRIVAYHKIAYTYIKHWKCQGHCKNVDFPRSVLKNNFSQTYTFARYCFEWKNSSFISYNCLTWDVRQYEKIYHCSISYQEHPFLHDNFHWLLSYERVFEYFNNTRLLCVF